MSTPAPEVRSGPHDRFACRSCAACCRSFTIALGRDEVARIEAGAWGFPWLEDAPEGAPGRNAPVGVIAKRADGACVFLDEDNLCLVEKRLGRASKPDLCRMFPLALVRAPDGALDATVVPECASWHESHEVGAPLASGPEIPSPLPARLVVIAPPALPVVLGGALLLWADVRALALGLGRVVAGAPSLEDALLAFGGEVHAAETAKGRRVIARSQATPPARGAPGDGDSRGGLLAAIAAALREAAQAPEVDPEGRARALGLAEAAEGLRDPLAWDRAFQGLPGPSLTFLRAVLRAWVEGPTLAQARVEVAATMGLLALMARVVAVRARALSAAAPPAPAHVNAAAKEASIVLRDPAIPGLLRALAVPLRALIGSDAPRPPT